MNILDFYMEASSEPLTSPAGSIKLSLSWSSFCFLMAGKTEHHKRAKVLIDDYSQLTESGVSVVQIWK